MARTTLPLLLLLAEASGKTTRLSHREDRAILVGDQDTAVGDLLFRARIPEAATQGIGLVSHEEQEGILRVTRALDIRMLLMEGQVEVIRVVQQGEARWMVQPEWSILIEGFGFSKRGPRRRNTTILSAS